MKFHILESGSAGNCTIVESDGNFLIIDIGITKKSLLKNLEELNIKFEDIKAVLFTHEHTDHIKNHQIFPLEIKYASVGTMRLLEENILEPYSKRNINNFDVTPIKAFHDAANPIGFIIEKDNEKLTYLTDTGYISEKNLELCKNSDFYIIESNHDIQMELKTRRPQCLKERILGDYGHLNNGCSASYVAEMIGENTRQIFLAHISREANTPELALKTYKKVFSNYKINPENYIIKCASQFERVSGGDGHEN